MLAELQNHRTELAQICARHRVLRLDVFGSAAGDDGDAANDLDFLVEFESMPPVDRADAWFGLQEDLQARFGRPVDLVEPACIENPYFLDAVTATRVPLYAA